MDSRSMGRELLDTFEAARKAADAAAEGGGEPDVERCVDSLRRLRKINVNMKALVDTQVGKRLRPLTKHPQEKIQSVASDLLKFWKDVVIEESTKDGKKNGIPYDKNSTKAEVKSERKETVKFEKVSKAGSSNVDMITSSESLKVSKASSDKVLKFEKVSKSPNVKAEKGNFEGDLPVNGRDKMLLGRTPKEEKENSVAKKSSSTVVQPPKFTAMVKCNNPLRDKIRELLVEAFSRVSKETTDCDREEVRDLSDEVDGCDPIRVAVTVESAMYERLGPSTGEHKSKYRSIMFNLKDSKNIDFRRRVLLGEVEATLIPDLDIEDMASDDMKLLNHKIKEKAMFECERSAAPKASTDQFKCGRCGQRKCTYYQLQTRSADEPMTTFVTCVNCNNHWKFC